MKITDAAVEAAACAKHHEIFPWVPWENLSQKSRDYYRNEVRGPLEAALPHLEEAVPTYSAIKDAIRTGLGGDHEEGCGCESHICSAADGVQALLGGAS